MAYTKQQGINSPSLELPPWLQLLPLDYLIRLGFTSLKDFLKSRLRQSPGLYEVLDYEAMLELNDARGRQAVYKKRQRVRFLRDAVSILPDYAWGDGSQFSSHRVRPGQLVERRQLGSRYRSLIALPAPKHKGDLLTFSLRRTIRDGFLRPNDQWLEAEVYHETKRLKLTVIFPKARPVHSADLLTHLDPSRTPLEARRYLRDGRQRITILAKQPRIGERYTLRWQW